MIKFMPIESDQTTNDPFDPNYRWPDEPRHPVFDTYFCTPTDPDGLLLAVAEHFDMDDDGRATDVDWFVAIAATGRPVRGHAYDIKLTGRDIILERLLELCNNQTMGVPAPELMAYRAEQEAREPVEGHKFTGPLAEYIEANRKDLKELADALAEHW